MIILCMMTFTLLFTCRHFQQTPTKIHQLLSHSLSQSEQNFYESDQQLGKAGVLFDLRFLDAVRLA